MEQGHLIMVFGEVQNMTLNGPDVAGKDQEFGVQWTQISALFLLKALDTQHAERDLNVAGRWHST